MSATNPPAPAFRGLVSLTSALDGATDLDDAAYRLRGLAEKCSRMHYAGIRLSERSGPEFGVGTDDPRAAERYRLIGDGEMPTAALDHRPSDERDFDRHRPRLAEIGNLFDVHGDEYLALVGDPYTVSSHEDGYDALGTLRLVANCLYAEYYDRAEWAGQGIYDPRLTETSGHSVEGDPAARLVAVNAAVEHLARSPGEPFVLCYHIAGTAEWRFAWSDCLAREAAIRRLQEFTRFELRLWGFTP
jgi:hypothetical protein